MICVLVRVSSITVMKHHDPKRTHVKSKWTKAMFKRYRLAGLTPINCKQTMELQSSRQWMLEFSPGLRTDTRSMDIAEGPEINSHVYCQLIFRHSTRTIKWGRNSLLTSCPEIIGYSPQIIYKN